MVKRYICKLIEPKHEVDVGQATRWVHATSPKRAAEAWLLGVDRVSLFGYKDDVVVIEVIEGSKVYHYAMTVYIDAKRIKCDKGTDS